MTGCKATCSTFLQLICPLHFLHKTHYVPVAMRITVTFPKTQINVDLPAKNSTKFKIVISKSLICSYIFSIRPSSKCLLALEFSETLNAAAKAFLNAQLLQTDYSRKSVCVQKERKPKICSWPDTEFWNKSCKNCVWIVTHLSPVPFCLQDALRFSAFMQCLVYSVIAREILFFSMWKVIFI